MSLRPDPIAELYLPPGTAVEERDIATDSDILVGGQSTVEFGLRGHNVMAGERVKFGGSIEADGDCRLDMWCQVAGNVLVGQNAYLGERVSIGGKLMVSGDLDIGDDVQIEDGFEANGWIVIRNPMPTIVFLFVYLSQLLHLGETEAAEELIEELEPDDVAEAPLRIPRGSVVSDDTWQVSRPATIGQECRLHGNIRATEITVQKECEIYGSLRSKGDIGVGRNVDIHGDVTTRRGNVHLHEGAVVLGDVACVDLYLAEDVSVEGAIRANGEVTIGPQ